MPMESIQRIVVIAPAQLGDVLLVTPLIHAARVRWPAARIDVLGFPGSLELLVGNPEVSTLIETTRERGLRARLAEIRRLWRRYDLALVTRTSDRSHVYGFIAAKRRSSLMPADGTGSFWKRLLTRHPHVAVAHAHEVLEKLRVIEPWAHAPAEVSLVPPPGAPLPEDIDRHLEHPCVVVQVPSMWRYKQWPAAHFRRVIEALSGDGVHVLLTGSRAAADRAQVDAVLAGERLPGVVDVSGRLTLAQMRTLLERSDAYLGPDTSVTHLAAAVGTPIVAVFGPSQPESFGPWPSRHAAAQPWQRRAQRQQAGNIVLLQGPDRPGERCVPCNRMGCEHRHDSSSQCLQGLAPERVLRELRLTLQSAKPPAEAGR